MRLTIIAVAAIFIMIGVMRVNEQLERIDHQLLMANCLTEAGHGVVCKEARR